MPNVSPPSIAFDDELIGKACGYVESESMEFKRVGNVSKQLNTLVAFANTEGGFLILGIEDEKKATGRDRVYGIQENPEAVDELRRKVASHITPPLGSHGSPGVEFHEIGCTLRDGSKGTVVLISAHKSPTVHSVVEGGTFVRLPKGNRQLSANEITELSLRRGSISFVAQPVDVPINLLDTAHWAQYAAARQLSRNIVEAMQVLGLARMSAENLVVPTRAAVLLFADSPGNLMDTKCAVRVFHYRGLQVQYDTATNLARPPVTIGGPLYAQIAGALRATLDALASGVQLGPLGFELAQQYPVRVIREALTNAIIHRDYSIPADIHVRVFDDRIEVWSPGSLPGAVTVGNIQRAGSYPRNRSLVDHLRDFPSPPNLDAGEGVRMMFQTMRRAELFPPMYRTGPASEGAREMVTVTLRNQNRPSVWEQVEDHLRREGTIGNAEVRALLQTDDPIRASKVLKSWVDGGLLVLEDPDVGKRSRRYCLPGIRPLEGLFAMFGENDSRK